MTRETLDRPEPRGRLIVRNTMINLLGHALPLILAVALMPPIIDGLGTERFGILAIAWMILGYLADIGFGRATTKFAAEVVAKDESARLPGIVWTTVAIQVGVGAVAAAALFAAAPVLVERVLAIPDALLAEARTSLYLVAGIIPAILLGTVYRGVLEAAQRFDLVNAVRVPNRAATLVLPLVGLALGWRLPGILALLLAARYATLIAFVAICLRLFPTLRRPPRWVGGELRPVFRFGAWVSVSSVISPALVYLDRFLLGALASMGAVTYYTAPYEVTSRLWLVPTSLVAVLFPEFSALSDRPRSAAVERLAARSVRYLLAIQGTVIALLCAAASDLLHVWLGPEFAAESTLALQILAVGVLVNSLAWVPYTLIQGLGRADLTAKFHMIELPIHIVVATVLVTLWGVPGAALAWSLRVTLDAMLLFGAMHRLSTVSPRAFWRERVPQTALILVGLSLTTALIMTRLDVPWVRGLLLAMLASTLGLVVWRYALGTEGRADLRRLLGTA
ncbi:MAG: flippase [Gemmatimonadota bacterium]